MCSCLHTIASCLSYYFFNIFHILFFHVYFYNMYQHIHSSPCGKCQWTRSEVLPWSVSAHFTQIKVRSSTNWQYQNQTLNIVKGALSMPGCTSHIGEFGQIRKIRQNDIKGPVASNVIGYILQIRTISTNIFISAQTL